MNGFRTTLVAAALAAAASGATAADVAISVGGEIAPGVYGRVDIGSGAPTPPVVYPQPVLIAQPTPVLLRSQPVYLHVPPGHAKNWGKHCAKYNACSQRVFFVKSAEYEPGYRGPGRGDERGPGNGNGKGHGKGRN